MTIWIRERSELEEFASSLGGCRSIALDSESDSLYHHFEKVCLVQVATEGGETRLIDPLALEDLSPLAPVLADPGVVKVLHGADYDVTTLKRDFGFAFTNVFDTMIAARFLGAAEIGLQAVALAELGVSLSKESQKDDWSRRPLSPVQEAYALADVRHLLALHARLAGRLKELGRLEWVVEECAAVAALEPARRRGENVEAYQRVKGARKLSRRGLAALRELYAWREGVAAATDTPAFKILGNETLLTMAEKRPRAEAELRHIRGVMPRLKDRAGAIIAALLRAEALPDRALPSLPSVPRPVAPEPQKKRADVLKSWRTREAARLGLDVSVVLPQRLIDKLAETEPREPADLESIPGLRRWRIDSLGSGILAALQGAGPAAPQ